MSFQPLSDTAKTALLADLVRERHPQRAAQGQPEIGAVWAVLHEVPPQTGWPGGYADICALHLWPSALQLVGYEVKASRSDLQRELNDLKKHETVARYCDAWWLVVWDKAWVDGDKQLLGIPDDWGLLAFTGNRQTGIGELTEVRKAKKRDAEPWPKKFTAALVRRALEAGAGTALARVISLASHERGEASGRSLGRREVQQDALKALQPWREVMRREREMMLNRGVRYVSIGFDPDNLESVLTWVAERAPSDAVAGAQE